MRLATKKKKKNIFKFALLAIVAYMIFVFINQQVKINNKKEEIARTNEQIMAQKNENEELKNRLNQEENKDNTGSNKTGVRIFENVT